MYADVDMGLKRHCRNNVATMKMGAMRILSQQYGSGNNDNTNFALLEGHECVQKNFAA